MPNTKMSIFRKVLEVMHPTLTQRFLYGYLYGFIRQLFAVKTHHVLLESHHGKNFGGNPYYVAAHLTSDPQYQHLRVIMVGPVRHTRWLRQHLNAPSITVIKPRGFLYAYYLATCKWLVSDVTFPLYFSLRPEQRYLNTWHGTPLKVLGRHIPGGIGSQFLNSQRNFLHASNILIPNTHTEETLLDSYCLRGLCEERILRCGYPRNDPFLRTKGQSTSFHSAQIAFMPTWRGSISDRQTDSKQQLADLNDLLDKLDQLLPASAILWVKLHPLVTGRIDLNRYHRIKPFPKSVETYEHLATCDALITDYSSVLFDFAPTRRPIIRYIPDEVSYEVDRGFCLNPDSLPFPCARTPFELAKLVHKLFGCPTDEPETEYARFLEIFNALDRGTSAAEVCRAFFAERPGDDLRKIGTPGTRPRIALYIGKPALSPDAYALLLARLDVERYTFILLIEADAITTAWESFLREYDPAFLYVAIQFHAYISPLELICVAWAGIMGWGKRMERNAWQMIGGREYHRLFGDIAMNVLISLDSTSIGSKLLENSRSWDYTYGICVDDVTDKGARYPEWLEQYCRQ